jgi:hypothetical protein
VSAVTSGAKGAGGRKRSAPLVERVTGSAVSMDTGADVVVDPNSLEESSANSPSEGKEEKRGDGQKGPAKAQLTPKPALQTKLTTAFARAAAASPPTSSTGTKLKPVSAPQGASPQ